MSDRTCVTACQKYIKPQDHDIQDKQQRTALYYYILLLMREFSGEDARETEVHLLKLWSGLTFDDITSSFSRLCHLIAFYVIDGIL